MRRRPEVRERGRDRREGKRVDCEAKPAPPRVVMSVSSGLHQLYAFKKHTERRGTHRGGP